jgi:HEAT repeat protein
MLDALRASDTDARITAIAALGRQGRATDEELAALADSLGHGRKLVQRRAAEVFAALAAAGVPVTAVLAAALDGPEARQRWGAAYALALVGELPARALDVLLETLGDRDGDLRWAAASILRQRRNDPELVQALVALVDRGGAAARKMALYCLRDLSARSAAIEAKVIAALEDPDRDVQLAAIATLAQLALDPDRAAAELTRALESVDERVRRAAAAALGALGQPSPGVLAALGRAAADPDRSLQRAAEGALRRLSAAR